MSAPQSIINICSGVRLDNRYEHSIYFADATAQQEYFAGKVVKTFPAYSYLRKSWPLQVQATMEEARSWSYLYFRNGSGKVYYYFINQIEYKNDNMVELTLELDVIQTYMFEYSLGDCFIERQHTPTDKVGEYTAPEGLELGPYWNYHSFNMESISSMGILVMSAMNLCFNFTDGAVTEKAYAQNFNGVYSGLGVYAFNDLTKLEAQLKALDEAGKADAITAIWMYPKSLVTVANYDGSEECSWDSFDFSTRVCARVMGVTNTPSTLALYTNYSGKVFKGYAPKNKKLFTYPYNMLYVTNNQGEKAEYRFEHFDTFEGVYMFRLYGAISPDAGVKLVPDCYNTYGSHPNYDEGINIGNYPQCAWDSDSYKVWLAQNYHQLAHAEQSGQTSALLGAGLAIGGAIATVATGGLGALGVAGALGAIGGGIGSIYSGFNQVNGILAQKEDAKAQPPQAKGTFSSTVNVANGRQTFTFYYKCIRPEYAKAIDDFFTLYGYKIGRVQKPNIKARPAYTYIKTVGCNLIDGAKFCTEDRIKITSIFDHGITFWVDGDRIADYSQNNAVEEV